MPKTPPEYTIASKEHLRRLNRLMNKSGVSRLKRLYNQSQSELQNKLSRLSGSARRTFTAQQYAIFLLQIKRGHIVLAQNMAESLGEASKEAQIDALRSLIREISKLEKKFTGSSIVVPIEEAARFAGIIDKNRSTLLKIHKKSMARYSANIIGKIEKQLALSLMQGESNGEAIDRIANTTDSEWWQAERIVRTEQAFAYNATHAAGISDASKDIPDMMMRWTEHVSDTTGAKLDDRVGNDSVVLHGQLAAANSVFIMPTDSRVSSKLWGLTWKHPPNRPNDRAVLQPWRSHWGIPGWIYRNGRRISVGK